MARSTSGGIFRFISFPVLFLLAAASISVAQNSKVEAVSASPSKASLQTRGKIAAQSAGLPLMFEQNVGQPGVNGDFTARGNGYTLDLNSGKMSLRATGQ